MGRVEKGEPLPTVEVEVANHLPPRTKGKPYRINVRDSLLEFQLVFFHARGDYLTKLLPELPQLHCKFPITQLTQLL